jgi:hypothetical protein
MKKRKEGGKEKGIIIPIIITIIVTRQGTEKKENFIYYTHTHF